MPILEGYHGTRRDISSVLPFLVDATTNDAVVRKLSVLSKLMLARKTITDAGGVVFYIHQFRAERNSRKLACHPRPTGCSTASPSPRSIGRMSLP